MQHYSQNYSSAYYRPSGDFYPQRMQKLVYDSFGNPIWKKIKGKHGEAAPNEILYDDRVPPMVCRRPEPEFFAYIAYPYQEFYMDVPHNICPYYRRSSKSRNPCSLPPMIQPIEEEFMDRVEAVALHQVADQSCMAKPDVRSIRTGPRKLYTESACQSEVKTVDSTTQMSSEDVEELMDNGIREEIVVVVEIAEEEHEENREGSQVEFIVCDGGGATIQPPVRGSLVQAFVHYLKLYFEQFIRFCKTTSFRAFVMRLLFYPL